MIDIERALNLPPNSSVTAKSCSRCGNRRRTEDHPSGHILIPPYWDRTIGICLQCAGELAKEHDADSFGKGWPADPLDEAGEPTIAAWVDAPPETPEEAHKAGRSSIKIEGWTKESKPFPIYCEGGPLHKTCLSAYAVIQIRVAMEGGYYEYHDRKYIWHQEA